VGIFSFFKTLIDDFFLNWIKKILIQEKQKFLYYVMLLKKREKNNQIGRRTFKKELTLFF